MWHAMRLAGWDIGRDQTARLMKLAGVQGARRGRTPLITTRLKSADSRPDLVSHNFHAAGPNRLWVADTTYVRTLCKFCYTAFVTDVFSRKIVGFSTRSNMRTHALPLEALTHALHNARERLGGELIHHSDRGSQYASIAYTQHLAEAGIKASVGTVGDSYDNALAESVNGLYKTELTYAKRPWVSAVDVALATMHWVHWWNTTRLHEGLDYPTPNEAETAYYETHAPTPVGA